MTRKEKEWTEYPGVHRLLKAMEVNSNLKLRVTPVQWPKNIGILESQTQRLNHHGVDKPERYGGEEYVGEMYTTEIDIMAYGEVHDIERLVKAKGLGRLDKFLNSAFEADSPTHLRFFTGRERRQL